MHIAYLDPYCIVQVARNKRCCCCCYQWMGVCCMQSVYSFTYFASRVNQENIQIVTSTLASPSYSTNCIFLQIKSYPVCRSVGQWFLLFSQCQKSPTLLIGSVCIRVGVYALLHFWLEMTYVLSPFSRLCWPWWLANWADREHHHADHHDAKDWRSPEWLRTRNPSICSRSFYMSAN